MSCDSVSKARRTLGEVTVIEGTFRGALGPDKFPDERRLGGRVLSGSIPVVSRLVSCMTVRETSHAAFVQVKVLWARVGLRRRRGPRLLGAALFVAFELIAGRRAAFTLP
jgi:hypothetical protein